MSIPRGKSKKTDRNRLPPFVPIFIAELNSEAYQTLTGSAAKALVYFKRTDGILIKKMGDNYNGLFDFTYSEAQKFGFARRTFSRVIAELQEKGFVDIIKQGGKRGCGMSNSKYKLSERWRDYGSARFIHRPRYPSEP